MALHRYSFSFEAMACRNELVFYAKNKKLARVIADASIKEAGRLEARYSRYLPHSLLTEINRSAGDAEGIVVDDETAALLNYAEACYRLSDGLFDVTSGVLRRIWDFDATRLPTDDEISRTLELIGWEKILWEKSRIVLPAAGMEIDFGGVVKEYAADTCANLCRAMGVECGMVNMGGDIHVIGPHPDGSAWKIGIQDPRSPEDVAKTIELERGGLASSGDYRRYIDIGDRRYSHILNPKTGWPVQGLRAVSVVAPHCLIAGSTSTIAMLKGEVGKQWLEETGLPYLWFDERDAVSAAG